MYRNAVELDPKFALAHNNLAVVLRDQGKGEEAAAECRTAIDLDPKLALRTTTLARPNDQGRREEAAAEYRKAVELDPKLVIAHNNLGVHFSNWGVLRGDRPLAAQSGIAADR